jgi:hypothetical protein
MRVWHACVCGMHACVACMRVWHACVCGMHACVASSAVGSPLGRSRPGRPRQWRPSPAAPWAGSCAAPASPLQRPAAGEQRGRQGVRSGAGRHQRGARRLGEACLAGGACSQGFSCGVVSLHVGTSAEACCRQLYLAVALQARLLSALAAGTRGALRATCTTSSLACSSTQQVQRSRLPGSSGHVCQAAAVLQCCSGGRTCAWRTYGPHVHGLQLWALLPGLMQAHVPGDAPGPRGIVDCDEALPAWWWSGW